MSKHKESKGNIFDGFPRTTPQAEAFDKIMEQHGTPVNLMLALEVSDDELIDRLLKRGKESGRADDSCESVIRNRIDVYKAQTAIGRRSLSSAGQIPCDSGNRQHRGDIPFHLLPDRSAA